MSNQTIIPKGNLAADDAAARKRKELKERLLAGKSVSVGKSGDVSTANGQKVSLIPEGKLATDDAAARKRKELKERLLAGKSVSVGKSGDVGTANGHKVSLIPDGKLAAQWYETNRMLFEAEKQAMKEKFPDFTLDKLDDGRLFWFGTLAPGIYESKFGIKKEYAVMAIYNNNHPEQCMGSSVRVYPVEPEVEELSETLYKATGEYPYHLLRDSTDNKYLCTNNAEDQKIGSTVTTAASVLLWAVKWLMSYELVLTGDLDVKLFNKHGGV